MNINNYFNRKFYSKAGRSIHAKTKPQLYEREKLEKEEINLGYVQTELAKIQSEQSKKKKSQKKRIQSSASFLTTTRDMYMRAFKGTCMESPSPSKYSPNIDFIKPSSSSICNLRDRSNKVRRRMIRLPFCIDKKALECSYPKIKVHSELVLEESELQQKINLRRSKTPKGPAIRNFVSFDKQSNRKFIPLSPVSESRFNFVNHFPKVSTKARRSPVWDFSRVTERKMQYVPNIPGPYDYDDRVSKASPLQYSFDMSRMCGRNQNELNASVGSLRNPQKFFR
ncbi:hypothetical protein SteCoe_34436 [Stentor coeruleus]|uniref:Uncharacterized protein n=1 Tax=Stentor coeruleus TaxID=5963 RepID=A0A1R2AUP9_9CILI|nr:hypothetical protein SteCoe_34436 [Stentor coeruleus]